MNDPVARLTHQAFTYQGEKTTRSLGVEGLPLLSLAETHGTPLYVYSASSILNQYETLKKQLPASSLICFALKSASNLSLLKLLAKNGAGADLVSGGELYRAILAGFDPKKIVYSGVGKSRSEIKEALRAQIYSFHIESQEELELLLEETQRQVTCVKIAFRFNPDVNAKTHPYISTGLRKDKFGLEKKEILALCGYLKKNPSKYISLAGLSIHLGSQMTSTTPLREAIKKLLVLKKEIETLLDYPLEYLDLGGGFGISYHLNSKNVFPIQKLKQTLLPILKLPNPPKLIVEPGRWLVGSSGVLLTRVLAVKNRGSRRFCIVDAAMNDLIRPALYQGHHEVVPLEFNQNSAQVPYIVAGPICESSDVLSLKSTLPQNLKRGDYLALLTAGAYGFSMSSQYNSRCRAAEVLVENGKARLIRQREKYEDLVYLEKGFL